MFATIVYWATNLNPRPDRFLIFLAILNLETLCSLGVGLAISAATNTAKLANATLSPVLVVFILFGGFYLNLLSLPPGAAWVADLSFIKWAYEVRGTAACPIFYAAVINNTKIFHFIIIIVESGYQRIQGIGVQMRSNRLSLRANRRNRPSTALLRGKQNLFYNRLAAYYFILVQCCGHIVDDFVIVIFAQHKTVTATTLPLLALCFAYFLIAYIILLLNKETFLR